MSLLRALARLPGATMIFLVRMYQIFLGPIFGGQCRFHPTCSEYFILAVKKHGAMRGGCKGAARLARCHPWHPGGEDWP